MMKPQFRFLVASFLLVVVSSSSSSSSSSSPVILVPGTGGSQLEARLVDGKQLTSSTWYCKSSTSYYFSLWVNVKSLLPFSINCWQENMKLRWDMTTMTVSNVPGVVTRPPNFGDTLAVETLDSTCLIPYMKPLVNFLTTLGYKKGKDIRAAPYDFRYSPDTMPNNYYSNLKTLIETSYSDNGDKPVTLISHSYGGPVTLYFLSLQTQPWKNKFLKQWIPIAGAFGGAKGMIEPFATGTSFGIPKFITSPLSFRVVQRTALSNLFMLPAEGVWPKEDVILETPKRSYTISDLDDFLRDIGLPDAVKIRHHIINSTTLMKTNPGVNVHCIYGLMQKSTVEKLIYNDAANFPDYYSGKFEGYGDGSLNYESLKLCDQLAQLKGRVGSVSQIHGADHTDIMSDVRALNALKKLL